MVLARQVAGEEVGGEANNVWQSDIVQHCEGPRGVGCVGCQDIVQQVVQNRRQLVPPTAQHSNVVPASQGELPRDW